MGTSGSREPVPVNKLTGLIEQVPWLGNRTEPGEPEPNHSSGRFAHSGVEPFTTPSGTMLRPAQSHVVGIAVRSLLVADGIAEMADVDDKSDRAAIKAIGTALGHVSHVQRARWAEEWAADLETITGRLNRFRWCWGLRRNSRRMGDQGLIPVQIPQLWARWTRRP